MARKPGSPGTVYVWSREGELPARIKALVSGAPAVKCKAHIDMPSGQAADFYIITALNVGTEREAARLGALPVCLPAADDWLVGQIRTRTAAGRDVHIYMRRRA